MLLDACVWFEPLVMKIYRAGIYSQNPVQSLTGAGFGNLLSANDPRINQLALKVVVKI